MTKHVLKAALGGAALVLALGLPLGGCENPANGDDDSGPSALSPAAEEFKALWDHVLEKKAERVTLSDEAGVDEVLEAYEALDGGVQAELAAEKAALDSLKTKITTLKSSVTALRVYLEGKPDNSVYTPYPVTYTGRETPAAIYNALGAAGKYVSLDLSGSNVTGFEYDVEAGRALVVHLVLPDSLEALEDTVATAPVFGGFPNLKSVSASGLLQLGAYAFYNCATIETVTLNAATDIGGYAFYRCTSLAAVNLPEAESLGEYVFQNCTSLATVNLPKAESLSNNVFYGCTSLATVSLPEAVTLGNYVFYNCTSLTTVTLPKAASLAIQVFDGCTSLATVTLGETPPTIAATARIFSGAATEAKTITIKVPNVGVYTAAGTPWTDKMGLNTSAGNYWDNTATTRGNLTVALEAISG